MENCREDMVIAESGLLVRRHIQQVNAHHYSGLQGSLLSPPPPPPGKINVYKMKILLDGFWYTNPWISDSPLFSL